MNKQNNQQLIKQLERSLVTYRDVQTIKEGNSSEDWVAIPGDRSSALFGAYDQLTDMEVLCPQILVRSTVAKKLARAAAFINKEWGWQLQVTYGFRSAAIQQRYFEQMAMQKFGTLQLTVAQMEKIHRLIAVPAVAGHPCGGAVDIKLVDQATGQDVDLGSRIYDFEDLNMFVFSPLLSQKQLRNRSVLRATMIAQGFAPFDGEWWHYSYGDREWAFWYGKSTSLYQSAGSYLPKLS